MTAPAEMGGENENKDFEERLAFWERALSENNAEIMDRFNDRIISELDSLCPNKGTECLFKGEGIYPIFDETGELSEIREGTLPTEFRGIHNGFQFAFEEEVGYKLVYEFIVHSGQKRLNALQYGPINTVAYIHTAHAVITPVHDFSEPFQPQTETIIAEDAIHETLSNASDTFAALIYSPNFRRLSHKRQRETVENYLQRYEAETGINHRSVALQALYFYRVNKAGNGTEAGLIKQHFGEEVIAGECLSLGTLADQKLAEMPIRRVGDLVDTMAGMCLVLALDDYHPELGLCRGDIVYVPLSGQNVETVIKPLQTGLKVIAETASQPNADGDGLIGV